MPFVNIRVDRRAPIVLFALFVLWQLAGIVPFTAYEGDAVSVSAGCEYTYRNGWATLGDVGYGYWLQPLSYVVIVLFKHLLPGVGCEAIYAFMSSVAALVLQTLTVVLAVRLTRIRPLYIVAALMLLPESYALAMYPNTATFCGCLFVGALCLMTRRRLVTAAVLLLLAPLMRIDVLVAYPVIPLVLRQSGYTWRQCLAATTILAVTVALTTWLMYRALGTDALYALDEHSRWADMLPLSKNLLAIAGFYGIATAALVIAGIIIASRRRLWHILALTLGIIVFVHVVQLRFANASKHFAMLMPFVVILSAIGIDTLARRRKQIAAKAAIAAIIASLLVGIRIKPSADATSTSNLNRYIPAPVALDFNLSGRQLQLVLGGGQTLMTADEAIMTSGNFFYPFFIHNIKTAADRHRDAFIDAVRADASARFVCATWEEMSRMSLLEQTSRIPADITIKDDILEAALADIDNPDSHARIIDYVRTTYSEHRPDTPAAHYYLVITEPISHRWQKLLDTLTRSGTITPADTTSTLYRLAP